MFLTGRNFQKVEKVKALPLSLKFLILAGSPKKGEPQQNLLRSTLRFAPGRMFSRGSFSSPPVRMLHPLFSQSTPIFAAFLHPLSPQHPFHAPFRTPFAHPFPPTPLPRSFSHPFRSLHPKPSILIRYPIGQKGQFKATYSSFKVCTPNQAF